MDKCCKKAALYVSILKSMAIIHQQSHWTAKGESFYGKHLLFEKIYDSALENLDLAAEKFIGTFGPECVDYAVQMTCLNKILSKYAKMASNPLQISLQIEKDFLAFSKEAYDCFEEEGKLSLGIDDMIMSIASDREEAVYLLQQSMNKNFHPEEEDEEEDEDSEDDENDMDEDSDLFE